MRVISVIYVSAALLWAASAAPLPEKSALRPRMGADEFVELDLTAREPQDTSDVSDLEERFTSCACFLLHRFVSLHNMRFISAIYVVSAVVLAASGAPLPEENGSSSLNHRASDVFVELDLTVREPQDPGTVHLRDVNKEVTSDRSSSSTGCIVA
ncbi:hypothetical protein B0H13DRAFT_2337276 [Mycena leptocephala]|nr:hypothetical protein B0H13DRAFT_2337276 [Mycena leptocephala]